MNVFCLSAGIILFAVMVSDIIKTTFSSNGGGRITNLVSRAVWNLFFLAAGKITPGVKIGVAYYQICVFFIHRVIHCFCNVSAAASGLPACGFWKGDSR